MSQRFHLAQVNIARMRGKAGDPVMAGLEARIEEMNRLAESSPGFVWRIQGDQASGAALNVFRDYFIPFEPARLFYNMSVWESVEALKHYVFKTAHTQMLRRKHDWTETFDRPHLALWWVPVGHNPTVSESAERLRAIDAKGVTPFAFTLKQIFLPQG